MNIKEFTKWIETDDYKILTKNSFVILHDDLVNEPSLGFNFWSRRDIPDEMLLEDQKDYPDMNIRRMKVSDIIESDEEKYLYVKSVLINLIKKP